MRRAARRPHIASSSPITSNISTMRCGDTSATTVPRRGCISTMPADASWNSASRNGVRDTSKRCASSTSSRRMPGGNVPVAMPSSSSSRTCSERVVALRSIALPFARAVGVSCWRIIAAVTPPANPANCAAIVASVGHRMALEAARHESVAPGELEQRHVAAFAVAARVRRLRGAEPSGLHVQRPCNGKCALPSSSPRHERAARMHDGCRLERHALAVRRGVRTVRRLSLRRQPDTRH